jgi:hypothetical protein
VVVVHEIQRTRQAMNASDKEAKGLALAPAIEAHGPGKADKKTRKKKKETAGLVVRNKKDPGINASRPNAEVEAVDADPNTDLLAFQSKRDLKAKKKPAGLALAPAIDPHGPSKTDKKTRKKRREPQVLWLEIRRTLVSTPVAPTQK